MYSPTPASRTKRVKLGWEWGRIVWFGLIIHRTKFQLPTMPRSGLKVPGGGGGGGVESKFSVQLRPKLNKNVYFKGDWKILADQTNHLLT